MSSKVATYCKVAGFSHPYELVDPSKTPARAVKESVR